MKMKTEIWKDLETGRKMERREGVGKGEGR
jgi:hypothetical protein